MGKAAAAERENDASFAVPPGQWLEPIFEADLAGEQHAYREGHSAQADAR